MTKLPQSARALWTRLVTPPELSAPALTRRAQMLHAVLLTVFATQGVLLVVGAPFVFARAYEGAALISLVLLAAAISWRSMRRGAIAPACQLIAWALWFVYSLVLLLSDPANVGLYIPTVLIATVLLGPAWACVIALAGVAVAATSTFAGDMGVYLPRYFPTPPASRFLFFITQSLLAIVPFYIVGRGLTRALTRAGGELADRAAAQKELQDSESRYRTMIATMAEGMMVRDMDGNLLLCNAAAERIIGLKRHEMARWSFPLDHWQTIRENGAPFPRDEHPVMVTMRTGRPCAAVTMGIQRGAAPVTWISINSVALRRDGEDHPYAVLTTFIDITQRKLAEKEQTDSERRYRTILDTMVEGVIMRGPRREVLISNRAAERILRVRPEQLQYEALREQGWRACREDGSVFPEHEFPFEVALRTGQPQFNVVMGVRRPDQLMQWMSINAQPVFEPGAAAPYAVVVSHTDITERKHAQQMLDRERVLLKTLVEHLPDDVVTLDTDGRFAMVNAAWLVQHGFTSDAEVVGRTVFEIFEPALAAQVDAERKQIMDTGVGLYNQSRQVPKPGGGKRWVLISKIPMHDGTGAISGILGIIRDVTELKTALDTLEQERNLLRAIIDSAPDAIYVKDRAGRYMIMNEAGLRLRGVNRFAEMAGKTAYDYFPAASASVIDSEDAGVMNTGRPLLDSQRRSQEPNSNERWISTSKFPLREASGAVIGLVTVNRDITELKNIIEEVRTLNAQLEDRVRLRTHELQEANRELEAFSYSVSHDLRAPLRSISGFGNFMLKDNFDQLDADGQARLERILAASERMSALIDDMLKLARISRQSISLREVKLHALAAETIAALRESSPERQVDVVIAPDLAIEADTGLMRILLDNLLGNAWKFTGRRADARIELGSMTVDGRRAFFVRDNGAGFDMGYAGKLFAPFQRMHTQQQFDGTGIGLATVKRIVERHHGRVWIDSAVDGGTTVYFIVGSAAE